MKQFKIVFQETKENGLNVKQINTIRNVLSDIKDIRIRLAWAEAMLDHLPTDELKNIHK